MTIAHCPKCREQVSIPSGVSRQARVRCPLCSEEYLLDDALRPLPPLLVVVHDPEAASAATTLEPSEPAPVFAGAEGSRGPAMGWNEADQFALEPAASSPPAFQFEPGSALAAGRGPVARSAAVASRPRARRKQAGPLRLIVQTVGGGVMGLVIAQLILWWMPGKWDHNNRDPFKLAAKTARYAPFLVPVELHGSAPSVAADERFEEPGRESAGSTNSAAMSGPGQSQDQAPGGLSTTADAKLPDFTFDATASSESPPAATPPAAPNMSLEIPKEDQPEESLRLQNPPDLKIGDISDRLAELVKADLAWDTAEMPTRDEKRRLFTAIYDRLRSLGEAVAVLGPAQPTTQEAWQAVDEKLQSLVSQSSKMVLIGQLGGLRLTADKDGGAAWYGTVVSHQARGKAFETRLQLHASEHPEVTVISSNSLAEQLPANSNVLILGRRIADPAKELVGYEGGADPAMLYGFHIIVP